MPKENKGQFKKGTPPWNKGKKCPWTSERNRLFNLNRKPEEHWNWKGGISKIDKIVRRMPEYLDWRKSIFERDNYTCRLCGIKNVYITAHHIKSFVSILREYKIKDTKKARDCVELWDINNGITLCEVCHEKTDNYKGRGRNK